MFIPRSLFAAAYAHLKSHAHPSTTSVLILCAIDTDSLCAARILASLLRRDYILHQIKPVAGYQDLERVNETLVKGNEELKFVICLGMGGLVDVSAFLELSRGGGADADAVECWVIDGRRPWNLYNVYGGGKEGPEEEVAARGGEVAGGRHGVGEGIGGVKCFDDGDIAEEMDQEKDAFKALIDMPELDDDSDSEDDDDDDDDDDGGGGGGGGGGEDDRDEPRSASEDEETEGGVRLDSSGGRSSQNSGRKRKSSDELMDDSEGEGGGRRSRRIRRDSDAVFAISRAFLSFFQPPVTNANSPLPQCSADVPFSRMLPRARRHRRRRRHTCAGRMTMILSLHRRRSACLHSPLSLHTSLPPNPSAANCAAYEGNTSQLSQNTTLRALGMESPSPVCCILSPPTWAGKTTTSSGSLSSVFALAKRTAAPSARVLPAKPAVGGVPTTVKIKSEGSSKTRFGDSTPPTSAKQAP